MGTPPLGVGLVGAVAAKNNSQFKDTDSHNSHRKRLGAHTQPMSEQQNHTRRLFIALELPSHLRRHLAQVIDELRRCDDRAVKWVAPDNMHLTLKFLGETPVERIEAIKAAVGKVMTHDSAVRGAFRLQSTALGAFPNLKRPRVFWASCVSDAGDLRRLERFAGAVDDSLGELGFDKEERAFKAHLTLGRVRRPRPGAKAPDLGALIEKLKNYNYDPMDFEINKLSLFESQLKREGPIYTALGSWGFGEERFG